MVERLQLLLSLFLSFKLLVSWMRRGSGVWKEFYPDPDPTALLAGATKPSDPLDLRSLKVRSTSRCRIASLRASEEAAAATLSMRRSDRSEKELMVPCTRLWTRKVKIS